MLAVVLAEMRALGAPEASVLQIEAVTAEADQRVAEAVARTARAEADQRVAEQQRDEADGAAEDASADAAAMTLKAGQAEATRAAAVADLEAAEQSRLAQVEQFTLELAAAHDATRDQQERAADAERIVGEQAPRCSGRSPAVAVPSCSPGIPTAEW